MMPIRIDPWRKSLFAVSGWAGMSFLAANAQVVTLTPAGNNLYNTGYDVGGALLVPGNPNPPDAHYQLTNYGTGMSYLANPLAPSWVANPGNAQWITVSSDPAVTAAATPTFPPTNPPGTPPGTPYDYRLTLTNIPAGRLITLGGQIAADDGVVIKVNGSSPVFSNAHSTVTPGNYAAFTPIPTITFVSGTTNVVDFLVNNVGGYATGLNTVLNGSYTSLTLTSTVGLGIQLHPGNLTPNQQSVLNGINEINGVGVADACFANLTANLIALDNSQFGAALDQLSPEKLDIFSSIAFNNASFMTQNLDDYLAHRRTTDGFFAANPDMIDTSGLTVTDPTIDPQLSPIYSHLLAWTPPGLRSGLMSDTANPLLTAPTPPVRPWNIFVQGNVILGQDFSDQDLSHENATSTAFEIGADYQVTPNFLVGSFFNYSHSDANLDENGSSATVDSYSPGIYASYAQGGWYENFLADYAHNAYTEQRVINIGTSFNETANGAPEGDQETVNLDGGYDFHDRDKKWTFGPTLGLEYTHFDVDSFTESGGCSADLAVSSQTADSFRSRLGGHVSYIAKDDGVLFVPFLDASWQHEFLDDQRGITASFSEVSPDTFTVFTPALGRESALLATGVNIDLNQMTTVFTSYQVQVTPDDYFGQSIIAGVKVAF